MNLLTDRLPEAVEIGGAAWPIRTGFRTGVRFELLMQDRGLGDEERLARALELYYPRVPPDLSAALDGLLWFYSCGRTPGAAPKDTPGGGGRDRRVYSFDQDAELIFAAFWAAYGIDLAVEDLHWWKFRALFSALPEDCAFCKVMGYRAMDTKGMGKKQKQFYDRMKRLHALTREPEAPEGLTLAERDRRMKDYVARWFAEVRSD